MARITFVYPNFESLGVEYLMAACRQAGHEVKLVFYVTGDSFVDLFKRQHFSMENIAQRVAATKPHLVAFSCVTDNYLLQLNCATAVKRILPDIVTIFGGIHPTAVPEAVLKEKDVDCVAIGEAEQSLIAFLKECRVEKKLVLPQHQIKGIVFKMGDRLIGDFREGELPDLDALPFPDKKPFYDCSSFFSYAYSIMTSRGCPYSCSYCFNSNLRSLRGVSIVRQRKVDNVIAEILQAKRDFRFKYVWFADDCFTANESWLIEFCRRYKIEVGLPFGCLSIPAYLNKQKINALRDANCYHVQMGVQSLNEGICREVLNRRSDNARIAEAISMLKDAGIMAQIDHLFGIPDDTVEMQEQGALFYNQIRPDVIGVFWLTYYPGLKINEIAVRKGILKAQDISAVNEGKGGLSSKDPLYCGSSIKEYRSYYGIAFLLHYIPFLPRWLVRFIIKRKIYKIFTVKNQFLYTLFPGALTALFQRKNFVYHKYFFWFVNQFSLKYGICHKRKSQDKN